MYNFLYKVLKFCRLKNKHRKVSLEVREKMSKRMSGINNPMYGKTGKLAPFFNKKCTQEHINKIKDKKCKKIYTLISPEGKEIQIINLFLV